MIIIPGIALLDTSGKAAYKLIVKIVFQEVCIAVDLVFNAVG